MMMRSVDKYLKRFEAFKNGELTPEEVDSFHEQLSIDQEMAQAWGEYNDMLLAFSDKDAISLREKLDKAFEELQDRKVKKLDFSAWYRVAASIAFVIVMGAILYFYCSSNMEFKQLAIHPKEQVESTSDHEEALLTNTEDTSDIILTHGLSDNTEIAKASLYDREEYQISPIYRELLHNVYRNAYFSLSSPADSIVFSRGDSILFTWETNIREGIYFDILDRNGIVVYTHSEVVTSPWKFVPDLNPAIYMFRFATQDEPIWMGVLVEKD